MPDQTQTVATAESDEEGNSVLPGKNRHVSVDEKRARSVLRSGPWRSSHPAEWLSLSDLHSASWTV